MHRLANFAHRRNFDVSYDSICTKAMRRQPRLGEKRHSHHLNQPTSPTYLPFIWPS